MGTGRTSGNTAAIIARNWLWKWALPPLSPNSIPCLFSRYSRSTLISVLLTDDALLAGQVDHGRALAQGEAAQLVDRAGLGLVGHLLAGADAVLQEHVQVGADAEVLVPVAAGVLQADEPHLAPRRAGAEAGPAAPFAVADRVGVLGGLVQSELDVVDGRDLEADRAERVDHVLGADDLLHADRLRQGLGLAAATGQLVDRAAGPAAGRSPRPGRRTAASRASRTAIDWFSFRLFRP